MNCPLPSLLRFKTHIGLGNWSSNTNGMPFTAAYRFVLEQCRWPEMDASPGNTKQAESFQGDIISDLSAARSICSSLPHPATSASFSMLADGVKFLAWQRPNVSAEKPLKLSKLFMKKNSNCPSQPTRPRKWHFACSNFFRY